MQWKRERGEKSIHWGMALKKAIKKKGGAWVIKIPDTEHDGCKYPYAFLLCRQLPGGVHAPSPGNCVLRKELCRCQDCLKGFQKLCKSKLMHWEMSFGNKISISSLWQRTGCMRWRKHFSSYGERSASLIWGGSEIFQQAFHWGGPDSGSGVISINRLLSRQQSQSLHFFPPQQEGLSIAFSLSSYLVFYESGSISHSSSVPLWVTWLMLGPFHIPEAWSSGHLAFQRHSEAAGHSLCQG